MNDISVKVVSDIIKNGKLEEIKKGMAIIGEAFFLINLHSNQKDYTVGNIYHNEMDNSFYLFTVFSQGKDYDGINRFGFLKFNSKRELFTTMRRNYDKMDDFKNYLINSLLTFDNHFIQSILGGMYLIDNLFINKTNLVRDYCESEEELKSLTNIKSFYKSIHFLNYNIAIFNCDLLRYYHLRYLNPGFFLNENLNYTIGLEVEINNTFFNVFNDVIYEYPQDKNVYFYSSFNVEKNRAFVLCNNNDTSIMEIFKQGIGFKVINEHSNRKHFNRLLLTLI